MAFNLNDIRQFLIQRNGTTTDHELVKHFKEAINSTDNTKLARIKFKELVNTLTTVKLEQGIKVLILRPEYDVSEDVTCLTQQESDSNAPQPPPRKKTSLRPNIKQTQEKENFDVNVRERAQLINLMVGDSKHPHPTGLTKKKSGSSEKGGEEDDGSLHIIDGKRKEWILCVSKADYHGMIRLLKDEPRFAHYKDYLTGYTALHWAAKHGQSEVVKLIAGSHRCNPNLRSHDGCTPLHIAAIFGHEEIMEILIHSYGAETNIRDYRGKLPSQYLPPAIAKQYSTKVLGQRNSAEHEFIRSGSLNSKTKKTGKLTALTRLKSWGSADNLPDNLPPEMMAAKAMPPPKYIPPKKKKLKKKTEYLSGGSDSDIYRSTKDY